MWSAHDVAHHHFRRYTRAGLARLFEQAQGYRGTTLLRPCEPGDWWLTIDRWETEADFEGFQRDFGIEYRGLDEELEGVAGVWTDLRKKK